MNKHLLRANDELVDYYTSSLCIRASGFEPTPQGGEGDGAIDLVVREIDTAALHDRRTKLAHHDAVRATLAETPPAERHILELVYAPFGTGFTPPKKATDAHDDDVAPDFLATALTPDEGSGSYVRLALTMPRTARTYAKQFPDRDDPGPVALLAFLSFEAGRGDHSASFFNALREDCDAPRLAALKAYDALRKVRRQAEKREDEERARRKKQVNDSYFLRVMRGEAYE